MRTFEIILAIILFVHVILPVFLRKSILHWVAGSAMVFLIAHLLLEGSRWQMIPLYGLTVAIFLYSAVRLIIQKPIATISSTNNYIRTITGLILLCSAVIPPILLPVPRTPEPTGPYDVGTVTITLVDKSREELYGDGKGQPRILNVKIWYPADTSQDQEPGPWLLNMDIMGPALAAKLNLPSFFLDHISYARTFAVVGAEISDIEQKYPLVLFSHGWGGFKEQNTFQTEELASHGYIVAAPDHTYGAIATKLPNGQVAMIDPEALPVEMAISQVEFLKAAQKLGNQWAGDLSYVIDHFESYKNNGRSELKYNQVDLSRVGVMGHSTGGGASFQFCASDTRCQAVLVMDPYMDPVSNQILNQGINKPFLAIFSEAWAEEDGRNNNIFEYFLKSSADESYHYFIKETKHYDFTDMPAFSPVAPYLGLKGMLDGEKVLTIINTYTLTFFERYIKGKTELSLDKLKSEFPEMMNIP